MAVQKTSLRKTIKGLAKVSLGHWVAFLTLIIFGTIVIYSAHFFPDDFGHVVKEVGVLFISIVPMVFIYERILRDEFLSNMEERMEDKMTEIIQTHLPENIKEVIQSHLPEHVNNIRESGISDVYNKLRYNKVIDDIEKVRDTKIRMLRIWIPSIEVIKSSLKDAIINRNCSVEITLCNPTSIEALEKRGRSSEYDLARIQSHINDNIVDLTDLWKSLPAEFRNKLQLKLHTDFISLSIIGIENYFIIGFYLHGRLSTEGTQQKIQGKGNYFYQDVYKHYKRQWEMAEPYNFT